MMFVCRFQASRWSKPQREKLLCLTNFYFFPFLEPFLGSKENIVYYIRIVITILTPSTLQIKCCYSLNGYSSAEMKYYESYILIVYNICFFPIQFPLSLSNKRVLFQTSFKVVPYTSGKIWSARLIFLFFWQCVWKNSWDIEYQVGALMS
jgi:hypothetical protein